MLDEGVGNLHGACKAAARSLSDGGFSPQAPEQRSRKPGQEEADDSAAPGSWPPGWAPIDERQGGYEIGPLLTQRRCHSAAGGVPDDRRSGGAEPIQDGADPAGMRGDVVSAGDA